MQWQKLGVDRPFSSAVYWENRYMAGFSSGGGSTGKLAEFKAWFLNSFVVEHDIGSVIEFGCGDGSQLSLAEYPDYLGVDVSPTAVAMCRETFLGDKRKKFMVLTDYRGAAADLALSVDVIYHLVEDAAFESHMGNLFWSARRFVVIYAPDTDEQEKDAGIHCRARKFSFWVSRNAPRWRLVQHVPNRFPVTASDPNGSWSEFFVYGRV